MICNFNTGVSSNAIHIIFLVRGILLLRLIVLWGNRLKSHLSLTFDISSCYSKKIQKSKRSMIRDGPTAVTMVLRREKGLTIRPLIANLDCLQLYAVRWASSKSKTVFPLLRETCANWMGGALYGCAKWDDWNYFSYQSYQADIISMKYIIMFLKFLRFGLQSVEKIFWNIFINFCFSARVYRLLISITRSYVFLVQCRGL